MQCTQSNFLLHRPKWVFFSKSFSSDKKCLSIPTNKSIRSSIKIISSLGMLGDWHISIFISLVEWDYLINIYLSSQRLHGIIFDIGLSLSMSTVIFLLKLWSYLRDAIDSNATACGVVKSFRWFEEFLFVITFN